MKIDLNNSPWALVLVVALFALMTLMVIALIFKDTRSTAIAFAGMWVTLIVTALGIGANRGRRGVTDDDTGGA